MNTISTPIRVSWISPKGTLFSKTVNMTPKEYLEYFNNLTRLEKKNKDHMKNKIVIKKDSIFKTCPYCDFTSLSVGGLRAHLTTIHKRKKGSVIFV